MSEEKRKVLSTFEWLMFLAGLFIVAFVMLQHGGFKVMETKETIEIVDNPNQKTATKKRNPFLAEKDDESVENVLKELAWNFSKENTKGIERLEPQSETNISKDELRYYKEVKNQHSIQDKIKDAKDWYQILKASRSTYNKLKDIFSESSGQTPKELDNGNVEHIINNKYTSEDLYSNLKKWFNISEEEARIFARKGKSTLSEWAKFVEEKQK